MKIERRRDDRCSRKHHESLGLLILVLLRSAPFPPDPSIRNNQHRERRTIHGETGLLLVEEESEVVVGESDR